MIINDDDEDEDDMVFFEDDEDEEDAKKIGRGIIKFKRMHVLGKDVLGEKRSRGSYLIEDGNDEYEDELDKLKESYENYHMVHYYDGEILKKTHRLRVVKISVSEF